MTTELVIRPYEPRDREKLMRLLHEVYPAATSPIAFSWRFEQNPTGTPIRVIAEDATGIIGFNSWMPWPLKWRGRELRAWQSGESAVHPSARGRGVFGQLIKAGAEIGGAQGGDIFFGFPNQASLGSFLRAKWKLIHTLRWWVRPSPAAFFGIHVGHRVQPQTVSISDSAFEFVREPAFVRWRITQNPYYQYRVDGSADGVRVFSRVRKRAGLTERLMLAGIDSSGRLLNPRQSASYALRSGARAAVISFTATERLAEQHAHRWFYRVRGKGVFFIVYRLNPSLDEAAVYSADAWEPSAFEADIL